MDENENEEQVAAVRVQVGDVLFIKRSGREIDKLLGEAMAAEHEPSRWPSMTFEQGVTYALRWLVEKDAPHPLED